MQNLIGLLFFALTMNLALADDLSQFAAIAKQIKNGDAGAIKKLELLYQSTSDSSIAINAAFILATAPEKDLTTPPHLYGEFSLLNNKKLSEAETIQLARIAGDGFFKTGQFAKAKKWYDFVLAKIKLSPNDKEYFVYKKAWCEINLARPDKAATLLNDWLNSNYKSLLREPMVTDLGRSQAEAHFIYKQSQNFMAALPLFSDADRKHYFSGLLLGFKRSKKSLPALLTVLQKLDFKASAWENFLQSPLVKLGRPCLLMGFEGVIEKELWDLPGSQNYLLGCLGELAKAPDRNRSKIIFALSHLQVPKLNASQKMMVANMFGQVQELTQSCNTFLPLAEDGSAKTPSWWSTWLQQTLVVCNQDGMHTRLRQILLTNARYFLENGLAEKILTAQQIPEADKALIIEEWYKDKDLWQSVGFPKFAQYVRQESFANSQKLMGLFCPMGTEPCIKLQKDRLAANPLALNQLVASVIDGEEPPESVPFDEVQNYLQDLDVENKAPAGELPGMLKNLPIRQDFAQVQWSERQSIQTKATEITKENVIIKIQEAAKLARGLQQHQWSSRSLQKCAQRFLREIAGHLTLGIEGFKNSGNEGEQWREILQEIKKWQVSP